MTHPPSHACDCPDCQTAVAAGFSCLDRDYTKFDDSVPLTERPLAMIGSRSYRCKGLFGWIMLSALDADGAMREAKRSTDLLLDRATLEIWNGKQYVAVKG